MQFMIDTGDWTIFALVVGARFLLPLLIPFYPLPGVLICLLLDAVDQTVFQVFTDLPLDGYQSYDKALDIHYLSVAYISTLRNWTNDFAFHVSRFLFYYRLVGVVLFETSQLRAVLLIFPNTFEYFFIWYEAVRLWWNPRKLSRTAVISAAAFIWIVIKLPQEYWIHIAQRDVTDTVKQLLGGMPDSAWGPLIAANIVPILLVLAGIGLAVFGLYRLLRANTPRPDHAIGLRADANAEMPSDEQFAAARRQLNAAIFDRDLLEKVALVSLITYIFAEILPNSTLRGSQIFISVALLVVATTAVSHVLARRLISTPFALVHFLAVFSFNMAIIYATSVLARMSINWANAVVFQALLSLIVTLFDRFQPYHLARFPREGRTRAART
jgi:hypothetical protein